MTTQTILVTKQMPNRVFLKQTQQAHTHTRIHTAYLKEATSFSFSNSFLFSSSDWIEDHSASTFHTPPHHMHPSHIHTTYTPHLTHHKRCMWCAWELCRVEVYMWCVVYVVCEVYHTIHTSTPHTSHTHLHTTHHIHTSTPHTSHAHHIHTSIPHTTYTPHPTHLPHTSIPHTTYTPPHHTPHAHHPTHLPCTPLPHTPPMHTYINVILQ